MGLPIWDPVSALRRRCRYAFRRVDVLTRLIPAIEVVLAASCVPVPEAAEGAMPVAIPPEEPIGDAGHRG
jgi:CRISPR-associated protein Cas1